MQDLQSIAHSGRVHLDARVVVAPRDRLFMFLLGWARESYFTTIEQYLNT